MSKCRYCGQEFTCRYIGDVLRPMHTCGEVVPYADAGIRRVHRLRCRLCGKEVFLVRPYKGGIFFADELGTPWSKHPCFDDTRTAPTKAIKGPRIRTASAHMSPQHKRSEVQPPTKRELARTPCPVCRKPLRPNRVNRHLRNAHRLMRQRSSDGAQVVLVPLTTSAIPTPRTTSPDSRTTLTRCDHCNSMVKPANLRRHLSRIHGVRSDPGTQYT
jgi:hypothetical protein